MSGRIVVERFLQDLKQKSRVFDIVFRSRHKNIQALADLDISPVVRLQHIYNLSADHFIAGPKRDAYDPARPDYYEFGIWVKGVEVYVKLSLGLPGKPVDCMSFHAAEFPIVYPLKNDVYEE